MKNQPADPLETKPIGPLTVQPEQWSQGARLAICHPDRGVIAVIEPINAEDEPTMETAQREPWDEAYARLFAASPSLLDEAKRLLAAYNEGVHITAGGLTITHIVVTESWAERLRRLIASTESAEQAAS